VAVVAEALQAHEVAGHAEPRDPFVPVRTHGAGLEEAGAHREHRMEGVAVAEQRLAPPHRLAVGHHLASLTQFLGRQPEREAQLAQAAAGADGGLFGRFGGGDGDQAHGRGRCNRDEPIV